MPVYLIFRRVLVVTNRRGERMQLRMLRVDFKSRRNDRGFGNFTRIVQEFLRGDSKLLVAAVQRRLLTLLQFLFLRLGTLEHTEETTALLSLLIGCITLHHVSSTTVRFRGCCSWLVFCFLRLVELCRRHRDNRHVDVRDSVPRVL